MIFYGERNRFEARKERYLNGHYRYPESDREREEENWRNNGRTVARHCAGKLSLMLYQLQTTESLSHHEYRQQSRDQYESKGLMRPIDETLRSLDHSRINKDNSLLLLDRPTPKQKRVVNGNYEEISRPEGIRVQTRSACSCESQYEIRDLGDDHYPRYLTATHCKPKFCQNKFHPCKLIRYKVHVLGLREATISSKGLAEDRSLPEMPLPESLRHKWQLKPLSVSVACVPI